MAAACAGIALFLTSLVLGPENATIQVITPNRMRGQVTAVMLFAFNVIGFGLGPLVIALFTDYLFGNEAQLGYALAAVSAILAPLGILVMRLGLKPYGTAVAAARTRPMEGNA